MKKFLMAAGVGALLIVAQTAASATVGAGLLGGTDVADTAPEAAPVATERAVPAAAVRPMMGMDAREAGFVTAMAATGEAGVTAPVAMTAVARVPDRLGSSVPSYNASLSLSTTQGSCIISYEKQMLPGLSMGKSTHARDVTEAECEARRLELAQGQNINYALATFTAAIAAAAVVVTNDDPASRS